MQTLKHGLSGQRKIHKFLLPLSPTSHCLSPSLLSSLILLWGLGRKHFWSRSLRRRETATIQKNLREFSWRTFHPAPLVSRCPGPGEALLSCRKDSLAHPSPLLGHASEALLYPFCAKEEWRKLMHKVSFLIKNWSPPSLFLHSEVQTQWSETLRSIFKKSNKFNFLFSAYANLFNLYFFFL